MSLARLNRELLMRLPLGRFGDTDELVGIALVLASAVNQQPLRNADISPPPDPGL